MPVISSFIASTSSSSPGWVEKFEDKGTLFALLAMSTGQEKRGLFSRTVFEHLAREYYGSHAKNPEQSLKSAFEKSLDILGEGQLFVALVSDTKLFCIGKGGNFVSLYRNGISVTLLKTKTHETSSVSGFIKPGDLLLCGTKQFSEVLAQIPSVSISSKSPVAISEFLTPLIHERSNGEIGVWVLKVKDSLEQERVPLEMKEETLQSHLLQVSLSHTLDKQPMYIKERVPLSVVGKKKTPLLLGILLVSFLVGSIIMGHRKQEQKEKEAIFHTQITSLNDKLAEAITLSHINPQRARELFGEVSGAVGLIEASELQKEERQRLQETLSEFQEEILGEKFVTLSLFVDLSLLSDGFSATQVTNDVDNMYVFDSNSKRIAKIGLLGKHAEIVAGPSVLSDITAITSYVDTLYGIGKGGIHRLSPFQTIINDVEENTLIFAYAGNIYILDKTESQIYKYNGGTLPKVNWFTEGVNPDLSNARFWIIDGTIWVLRENGEFLHFANGNQFAFSLYGVVPTIENPTSFYTDESSDNIYVLDSLGKRIVVFEKSGAFVTQYVAPELKEGKFLVVKEEEGKVFVAMENKVYFFEIDSQ